MWASYCWSVQNCIVFCWIEELAPQPPRTVARWLQVHSTRLTLLPAQLPGGPGFLIAETQQKAKLLLSSVSLGS